MEHYILAFRGNMAGPLAYYKTKRIRFDDEKGWDHVLDIRHSC